MPDRPWMIYGASGYTGALLAEEAARRGHRPLLAGRSAAKLAPLAERLGLEWIVADLADPDALRRAVERVGLVLHAAGPFVHTHAPMADACLAAGADYLDISGELPVLRHTFACGQEAREQAVLMVSGCGFDVIPTDCLALQLASRMPDAVELEIAVNANTTPTAGTLISSMKAAPEGGWAIRDGELRPMKLGRGARVQRFTGGESTIAPLPLGDLITAFRSTGIANVTTYLAVPRGAPTLLRFAGPVLRALLATRPTRSLIERAIRRFVPGPSEADRMAGRSYIWARVRNARGESAEAWLETAEAYRFTQLAAISAVERALQRKLAGALSPAQAFGADFVMTIEGTRLFDAKTGGGEF